MARQKYQISALFPFGVITRQVSIGVGKVQVVDQSSTDANAVACTNTSSGCDLHGAIALANRMAPLPLIVQIKTSQINLPGTALSISGDVSILGSLQASTIIDATARSGHFKVNPGAYLELTHLKLINGSNLEGGSVSVREASLLVKGSQFVNNLAGERNTDGKGGAIFASKSTLEVVDSEFTGNRTPDSGGGGGGAIYAEQSISTLIRDSKLSGNYGISGGAIHITSGNSNISEISNCSFNENSAMKGGAIYTLASNLSVEKSNFVQNHSAFDGGAIAFQMTDRAWVRNSLFDANVGAGFGSVAIFWEGQHWGGYQGWNSALYLLESKLTHHQPNTQSTAVVLIHVGQVILRGTTFENNQARSCNSLAEKPYAEFFDLGGNHMSDETCLN
jgi:predicted outer membrane repeat protein